MSSPTYTGAQPHQGNPNLKDIPRGVLRLAAPTKLEVGDNGENAKTAPVKMLARTWQPIDMGYWGKLVHDKTGLTLHKKSLPIDYCHFSEEVLGYLNKFEVTDEGLMVSGALTPFEDGDRANEVMFKAKAGVPYEASIDYGGDGLVFEEVRPNAVADVNGYQLEGPAIIVRKWPLRGVAICPYGADMNTNTQLNRDAAGGQTVAVTILQKESDMGANAPAADQKNDTTTKPQGETKPAGESEEQPAEVTTPGTDSGTAAVDAGDKKLTIDPAKAKQALKLAVDAGLIDTKLANDDAAFIAKLTKAAPAAVDVTKLSAKEYGETFGDIGYRWHAEGKPFQLSTAEFITQLKADQKKALDAANTEIADLKKKLGAIPRGDEGVSAGLPGGATAPPSQLAMNVGTNVARFANSIKLAGSGA